MNQRERYGFVHLSNIDTIIVEKDKLFNFLPIMINEYQFKAIFFSYSCFYYHLNLDTIGP